MVFEIATHRRWKSLGRDPSREPSNTLVSCTTSTLRILFEQHMRSSRHLAHSTSAISGIKQTMNGFFSLNPMNIFGQPEPPPRSHPVPLSFAGQISRHRTAQSTVRGRGGIKRERNGGGEKIKFDRKCRHLAEKSLRGGQERGPRRAVWQWHGTGKGSGA